MSFKDGVAWPKDGVVCLRDVILCLRRGAFEAAGVAGTSIVAGSPPGGASFAAVEDEETSYSGPRVVFARLFLGGGFFGLMGFFLGAMATIQSTNVVGGTLYMPTRYRMFNSFKSSPLMNAVDNAYI